MSNIKILVVEDNAIARLDIQAALERSGYFVSGEAVSGEEAIIKAEELKPDIVLMDIRLEGQVDGIEAAGEIMRRFDIPIIYLTVYADDETLQWAKISGPFGYLLKPVDHKELKSAIEVGLFRHQMETELKKARKAAETADRAKTSFLATISHELRTPMNGVLGMTELLLLSDLGDPYRENVELIKDSAMSLLSVLNQIIDYSKLEASSLKLRDMDFRLEDLVTGLLSQYNQSALTKGVRLEYFIDPEVPEWLRGDSGKIRQALSNLLNNAVKFTRSGHIRVEISPAQQNGILREEGEALSVRISVQDTGIGLSEELQGSMFDSFTLGEDYLCHTSGGLGLGLAIVARLVHMLGGKVSCTSVEGEGSDFSFTVPLHDSRYNSMAPLGDIMTADHPLAGARVLVAEDDLVNQRYITRLLAKLGCTVELAETGRQAIDLLKRLPFDIVLMDVEMPELNGLESTRLVRAPQTGCLNPEIPIVALTAHAMWGDEKRCLHAGMDDYIPKPVEIDTLASIIQSILEK